MSRPLALAAVSLAALAWPAWAQQASGDRPGWQEDTPPPPPAYATQGLIELEMPRGTSVRMGIDPKTLSINHRTGVVRYVAVARGPSALNATYEGIRCATGEYRVYARQVQGGEWTAASDSAWKPMRGQSHIMVQHPYKLARDGVCQGTGTRQTVGEIVRALRSGGQSDYR